MTGVVTRFRPWVCALIVALGCHPTGPRAPVEVGATVLEHARSRPVPDPTKARFNIKLRSKPLDLAGSTGGGLIVDRPGQTRIELFGPMGNPLFTAISDGDALSILLTGEQRHLVSTDAEAVLRETTGGVAGLDDMLAALVGDLPFDDAEIRIIEPFGDGTGPDDGVRVVLIGPVGTTVEAILDAELATPKRLVARDKKGDMLLSATYDRFELVGVDYMPTRVELYVPSIDLSIETRYRDWTVAEPSTSAFAIQTPDGYTSESLEEAVRKAVDRMTERNP